jgi:Cu/Zn superoxide dismutase
MIAGQLAEPARDNQAGSQNLTHQSWKLALKDPSCVLRSRVLPWSLALACLGSCSGRVDAPGNAVRGMGDDPSPNAGKSAATGGSGPAGGAASSGAGGGSESSAAGAGGEGGEAATQPAKADAEASLMPTTGNAVTGSVHFTQEGEEVAMLVTLKSCPAGAHALHLHANAACDDDANAAGGHWSPRGDGIGEVVCAADGSGSYGFSPPPGTWSIAGAASSDLLQHALVLHQASNRDPGARIACGIPAKVE